MNNIFLISCMIFVSLSTPENLTEHTLKMKDGAKAEQAEISQFRFLQGAWIGTGFGANCDEMWSSANGDCMLGTFRMVKDDQLKFTEFCLIQKNIDGGVVLRLKHFNPEFVGWENKDDFVSFPLIKVQKNKAYFEGLTYALQSDGSLKIWVAIKQNDGTFKESALHLQPVAKIQNDR